MIQLEQAQAFIESKKGPKLTKNAFHNFSEKYKILGLLITKLDEKQQRYTYYSTAVDIKPYVTQFGATLSVNPWRTDEGTKLALLIFGPHIGLYIASIWDLILKSPYQTDYNRRSFRSTSSRLYLNNRISYLQNLYHSNADGHMGLTVLELAQYDVYETLYYRNNSYVFAAALQDDRISESLFVLLQDIIAGEDAIGGVTKALLKGLLLTETEKNWGLVANLLLAAQRQEGLRQTILEALDETSLGALQYFITLILDHNLMRFSSVVRAVDTWFGFGWEAPKTATIKRVLELSQSFFETPEQTITALARKDNLEVYVALWFLALKDVDAANLKAIELIKTRPHEKQILACMFIVETRYTDSDIVPWLTSNFGTNLELDFWLLQILPDATSITNTLFEKIKTYGVTLPSKGKTLQGTVFSWTAYTIKPNDFFRTLIHLGTAQQLEALAQNLSAVTSNEREQLLRKLFPKHFKWSYEGTSKIKAVPLNFDATPWKRTVMHQAIKDRNASVMATGLNLFESAVLNEADENVLIAILQRKHKDLRERVITIILGQENSKVEVLTSNLIASPKIDQRLAALEILTVLHDKKRMLSFVEAQVNSYLERGNPSKNESVFLEKFSKTTQKNSFSNGFGVIDFANLHPLITPVLKFGTEKKGIISTVMSKWGSKFLFKDLINIEKTVKAINTLIALFEKHQQHEYTAHYANGHTQILLLSDTVQYADAKALEIDDLKEKLNHLPLAKLWIDWYEQSQLNDFEMLAALFHCEKYPNLYRSSAHTPFLNQYIPDLEGIKLVKTNHWNSINSKIHTLLNYLYHAYTDSVMLLQFKIDVLEDLIARYPEDLKAIDKKEHWDRRLIQWCDSIEELAMGTSTIADELRKVPKQLPLFKRYWDLKMYLLASKLVFPNTPKERIDLPQKTPNRTFNGPNTWLTTALFKANVIGVDDFKFQLLTHKDLFRDYDEYISGNLTKHNAYLEGVPQDLAVQLKENLLALELERGDLETDATNYLTDLSTVAGISYLVELLTRLGKDNFHRGYYWYNSTSKKEVFSHLIKKCIPKVEEGYTRFLECATAAKISKKRWIETAIYAPQWAPWIGNYLKLETLEAAVWWFHAHASEYMTAEKETIISRYSNIDRADFSKGSIDLDWFNEVYPKLGKQNFKLLHDAAKYISDGNGHRLIKLYASVILGEIKIRETLAKITEKRDKDYVKAFGLVPLSKTNLKKDLLNRYTILQDFLKESKQFGAQRQTSEKNAVDIALDNLARNAGYDDSIRFSWAMEGEATQQIMETAVVSIAEVTIELFIDIHGKADLKVLKDGKHQKSIPAKLKKHKDIVRLQKHKTYLRKQYARTRVSLEHAMLREEVFRNEELNSILKHPIVKAMLSKLILFNKTQEVFGIYKSNSIETLDGKLVEIDQEDAIVIAHASHLYHAVVWDEYQKYAFNTGLVQPFKQIFRELYVITKDELEDNKSSQRYQGHQIQPQKTIALLRSRGWTVNQDEGLQKVYHKKGYIASLYAMADWFSPSDIEAPTLEHIAFHDRNNYQPVALSDIDPVTYSEVMRDIDLVVSVAHVGGVDPEASHSTMQMRGALSRETARLFKATNVTVKERHIIIKGKLAEYSIHLGSGNVSKNGLQLAIIPVHSQHRGRLFLPFIDDDPKTAEIISKMKLLSEDDKIKDPTILRQIQQH